MTTLEPNTCKHCGAHTSQYAIIDLHFKQRRYFQDAYTNYIRQEDSRNVCYDNTPVFLCADCVQSYVNRMKNNTPYKRRDVVPAILVGLIACALSAAAIYGLLEIAIYKYALAAAVVAYGIYGIINALNRDTTSKKGITNTEKWIEKDHKEYLQSKAVLMSLIPCILGIALFFLPAEVSALAAAVIMPVAFILIIIGVYNLIRGHRNSVVTSEDLPEAIKFYFLLDDDIELIDNNQY